MSVREPVDELQTTRLWQYLLEVNPEYAQRALTFVGGVAPVLASIVDFFPNYTRHDAHHGYRVVQRIVQVLEPECLQLNSKRCLSGPEAFLLIAAAYAHDLGMAVFPGEEQELLTQLGMSADGDWKHSTVVTSHLRENHSVRGLKHISACAEQLAVPRNLVNVLGQMMRAHNLSIHELEIELGGRVAAGEQEIDLKQLAIILCVGDALEYSDTRVIDGVIDRLSSDSSPTALVSYRENMKHVCIGDSVAIGDDGRVVFSGSFTDPDVLALAHSTIDLTEEWVREYCYLDLESSKNRLRIRSDAFIRNLVLPGVDYQRLGVRIKKENVIALISSNATWSGESVVPVRELLQNAVEACRYRSFNTPEAWNYEPKIVVTVDRANRRLSISDNGCGMSKHVILNNFLTVGNSRSLDAVYQSNGYSSLARFGIGFWSVFTIATSATMKTIPFESHLLAQGRGGTYQGVTFGVSLDNLKDYTVFEPVLGEPGTLVVLELKKDVDIDSVLGRVRDQIHCSSIPMSFVVLGESNLEVPSHIAPLAEEEIFGARRRLAEENQVLLFGWSGQRDTVEATVTLAYRMEGGKGTFLMADGQNSMLRVVDSIRSVRSSVCGFSIPLPIGPLPFEISRVGASQINVTSPKGFRFRLDRHALLPSDELRAASSAATSLINEAYRDFLSQVGCSAPEDIYNLSHQSRMHGGEVSDSYTDEKFELALQEFADLVALKLYEVDGNPSIRRAAIQYTTFREFFEHEDRRVLVCQSFNTFSNRYYETESLMPLVYTFATQLRHGDVTTYVTTPFEESSILFDNSSEVIVHLAYVEALGGPIQLHILDMQGRLVPKREGHPWVIGQVRGRWIGTVYERPIKSRLQGDDFVFLGRYRLVVRSESRLAKVMRGLSAEGKTYAMSELAARLRDASDGHVADSLREEWPEMFRLPNQKD